MWFYFAAFPQFFKCRPEVPTLKKNYFDINTSSTKQKLLTHFILNCWLFHLLSFLLFPKKLCKSNSFNSWNEQKNNKRFVEKVPSALEQYFIVSEQRSSTELQYSSESQQEVTSNLQQSALVHKLRDTTCGMRYFDKATRIDGRSLSANCL